MKPLKSVLLMSLFVLMVPSFGVGVMVENKEEAYEGYWRFVKEDFRARHPWWPGWMVGKALKTRLFLSKDVFIQYKSPTEKHGEPKKITFLEQSSPEMWEFGRQESDGILTFSLTKSEQGWVYREGKTEYLLRKESPQEVIKWKSGEK
jgi:hypothetical protein